MVVLLARQSTQNKWAILIGAKEYYDRALCPLEFSTNDMNSLREILVDPDRGGYDPKRTLLLTDGCERDNLPTRNNIISCVSSLVRTAESADTILFAFSGHGMEEDGSSYLLPADARSGVLAETAISVRWIKERLGQASAIAKIMILDACHAGAMIGKSESGRMTQGFSSEITDLTEGFATFSSCKLNEASYEWKEKQHGVFSYYLCEGLMGYADTDQDGTITLSEANRYVTKQVKAWAFAHNLAQSPNLVYTVSGDISLVHVPSSVSVEQLNPKMQILTIPGRMLDKPVYQNDYVFEGLHLYSALNMVKGRSTAKIALVTSGFPDEKHEALQNLKISKFAVDATQPDPEKTNKDYTTSLCALIASPRLKNNFVGVAPYSELLVYDAPMDTLGITEAIEKAVGEKPQLILVLMGSTNIDETLKQVFETVVVKLGITVVSPAGNDGSSRHYYPAAYDQVLSVASIDMKDTKSEFSNYGE